MNAFITHELRDNLRTVGDKLTLTPQSETDSLSQLPPDMRGYLKLILRKKKQEIMSKTEIRDLCQDHNVRCV